MCFVGCRKNSLANCRRWVGNGTLVEEFHIATLMHVTGVAGISDDVACRAAELVRRLDRKTKV